MTDAWFSVEFAQSLRWLSLLSLLSISVAFPLQGLYRTAITRVWMGALATGLICLGLLALALLQNQPAHVLRPLFAMGIALTVAFGTTFGVLRKTYRDAELKRTVS